MGLGEAATAIDARRIGAETRFEGVSTDTRSVARGELFVAIRGERYDGHDFLQAAKERGAAAAMVDTRFAGSPPMPALVVDDTRRGLGRLGRAWRRRFSPVVIAVAGSNGKTTTKEMLASILSAHAGAQHVLATRGNLNTDIGVPMTLLGLRPLHRYCAIELGMNHPGEIDWLAGIALPEIALVTNAQREHQEFMRSVEATAEENAGALRALPPHGTAVVNADDACLPLFLAAAGRRRVLRFGLTEGADVRATFALAPLSSAVVLHTPAGDVALNLAIPGLHSVRNAAAAATCALAVGVAPAAIAKGLEAFRPFNRRLQVKRGPEGSTLIDDSYNANPDSVRAAIEVLAAAPGETLLVLGDMGEVGEDGPAVHREVGRYARERGIDALFALGAATGETVQAFGPGARHFASVDALVAAAREATGPGTTLLVKGSLFMGMDRVVSGLTGVSEAAH